MLQEKYLPDYDFAETHRIAIRQTPEKIFALVNDIDLRESLLIRFLFALRGLVPGKRESVRSLRKNFIDLEQHVNSEIILGLAGQFWKGDGNLQQLSVHEFCTFRRDGFLKATWNFKSIPQGESVTLLETETRIKCFGDTARKRFGMYWLFIKPFSGLIRKEILRLIKQKAERM